jgi:tubulin polyglutamylase TTLL6/13
MYIRPLPRKPSGVTVSLEHTIYPAVERCIRALGYTPVTDHRIAVLFWHDSQASVDQCLRFKPWQFLNHFPGTFAMANKVALARSLERLQKRFPEIYDFHPQSFALPTQLYHLQMLLSRTTTTYIVKPDIGSQGRGIFLVQDPQDLVNFRDAAVAQEYIAPFLISGLKFDLRIYVLLASVDPLRLYIFEEGMARFCTETYVAPDAGNLGQIFRHLTNYSLNKHNVRFQQNGADGGTNESSHKRSMKSVFNEIERSGGDVEQLQADIEKIVVLTVLSVHAFLRHNYRASFRSSDGRSRCFEILGFDILVDNDLKPWVLEVNHSPSFHCDSEFDLELKEKVITQALRIVDIPHDYYEVMQQLQKDKAFDGAASAVPRPDRGYSFEREQRLARATEWKLLYPVESKSPLCETFEEVFAAVDEMAVLGIQGNRTATARAFDDSGEGSGGWPMQRIVVPPTARFRAGIDPTRPTRSVLLLQQARKAKILEQIRQATVFAEYEPRAKSVCSMSAPFPVVRSLPDSGGG